MRWPQTYVSRSSRGSQRRQPSLQKSRTRSILPVRLATTPAEKHAVTTPVNARSRSDPVAVATCACNEVSNVPISRPATEYCAWPHCSSASLAHWVSSPNGREGTSGSTVLTGAHPFASVGSTDALQLRRLPKQHHLAAQLQRVG